MADEAANSREAAAAAIVNSGVSSLLAFASKAGKLVSATKEGHEQAVNAFGMPIVSATVKGAMATLEEGHDGAVDAIITAAKGTVASLASALPLERASGFKRRRTANWSPQHAELREASSALDSDLEVLCKRRRISERSDASTTASTCDCCSSRVSCSSSSSRSSLPPMTPGTLVGQSVMVVDGKRPADAEVRGPGLLRLDLLCWTRILAGFFAEASLVSSAGSSLQAFRALRSLSKVVKLQADLIAVASLSMSLGGIPVSGSREVILRLRMVERAKTEGPVPALTHATFLLELGRLNVCMNYDSRPTLRFGRLHDVMEQLRRYFEHIKAEFMGLRRLPAAWQAIAGCACDMDFLSKELVSKVREGHSDYPHYAHSLKPGRRVASTPLAGGLLARERGDLPNVRRVIVEGIPFELKPPGAIHSWTTWQPKEPAPDMVTLWFNDGLAELNCTCRVVGF